MKKILTYTILAACILALSACSQKQLDPPAPEIEVDETAPISFSTGVAGTKGLIESQTALDNTNTRIKVFDFMKVGDQPEVKYIEDVIKGKGGDGDWKYQNEATTYYWTKTGTHTFFGYMTQDLAPSVFVGATEWASNKKLLVARSFTTQAGEVPVPEALRLTPDTTPQFDFMYSDIITRNAAIATDRVSVDLSMMHLFTALAVEIVNQTGVKITNLSVSFNNVFPEQYAEIDWGTPVDKTIGEGDNAKTIKSPKVNYNPERTAANAKPLTLNNTPIASVPVSVYSDADKKWSTTPLFFDAQNKLEYRLLWPQTILPGSGTFTGSQISISYDGCAAPRVANLYYNPNEEDPKVVFEDNKLDPNNKYLLTITIKPTVLELKVVVDPLVELYYGKEGYGDYLLTPVN